MYIALEALQQAADYRKAVQRSPFPAIETVNGRAARACSLGAAMYEHMEASDDLFLGFRIQGEITDSERRELVEMVEKRFKKEGPVRLLVVHEADPGMADVENLYEDMGFAKSVDDKLARMTVIGNQDWKNTWVGMFGLFNGIEARFFPREQADAAVNWLRE
jgi:hypothetical protein